MDDNYFGVFIDCIIYVGFYLMILPIFLLESKYNIFGILILSMFIITAPIGGIIYLLGIFMKYIYQKI
jgi:hypothetical protein